jgi:glycosyltransferase involved in cell wall biosynthesis
MPAHNAAETIEAAVSSVLRQTLAEFELIVVDDGSSDGTSAIVRSIGDPRIVVIQQSPCRGAAAARNAGVNASQAVYLTLMDSDDLLLPRYLEVMVDTLRANPGVGFVHADAYVMNAASGRIRRTTATEAYRPSSPPPTAEQLHTALMEVNFVYNAVSLPRYIFDQVGGFDESLRATIDYEMWLRIAAYGFNAVEAPGPLAVYRWGRQGSISSDRERVLSNMLRVYELALERHPASDSGRRIARRRHEFVAAELAAVRGARTVDGLRRRLRDRLASTRFRLRSESTWYPADAPPASLHEAFPELFPSS